MSYYSPDICLLGVKHGLGEEQVSWALEMAPGPAKVWSGKSAGPAQPQGQPPAQLLRGIWDH